MQTPQPIFLNIEYLFYNIYKIVKGLFTLNWLTVLYVVAVLLLILLITSALYSLVRLYELHQEDEKKKKALLPVISSSKAPEKPSFASSLPGATEVGVVQPKQNETWRHVRERLLSDTPSDWRLAIIEADIYLDRVLDAAGYHGDTMSDKLKQVTPDKIGSIQMAWEAHKVRNRIAHEGAAYTLTMPEARKVLSLYEIVFRDFEVID